MTRTPSVALVAFLASAGLFPAGGAVAFAAIDDRSWVPETAWIGVLPGFLPAGGEAGLPTNLVLRFVSPGFGDEGLLVLSDESGELFEQRVDLSLGRGQGPGEEPAPLTPRVVPIGVVPVQLDLAPHQNHRARYFEAERRAFDEVFQTGAGPDETPPTIGALAIEPVPEEIWFCDFQPCPDEQAQMSISWTAEDDFGLALYEFWQRDDAGDWALVGRRPAADGPEVVLWLRTDRDVEVRVTAVDFANHRTDSPPARFAARVQWGCQGAGVGAPGTGLVLGLLVRRRRRRTCANG